MKNSILFSVLAIIVIVFEHGFLHGLGGSSAHLLLALDLIIWQIFFFHSRGALEMVLFAGLVNEYASPYYFGSALLALFFSALAAKFLTDKIFTNRSSFSFVITSFFSLAIYFLSLGAAALLALLGKYKIFISPLEPSIKGIIVSAAVNIIFLMLLYIVTNLFTKKMHAAFIVK